MTFLSSPSPVLSVVILGFLESSRCTIRLSYVDIGFITIALCCAIASSAAESACSMIDWFFCCLYELTSRMNLVFSSILLRMINLAICWIA